MNWIYGSVGYNKWKELNYFWKWAWIAQLLKQKDENASIFRRGKNNRLAEYFLKSATSQHLRDANGNRTGDLTDMRRTLYEHGYGGQI